MKRVAKLERAHRDAQETIRKAFDQLLLLVLNVVARKVDQLRALLRGSHIINPIISLYARERV